MSIYFKIMRDQFQENFPFISCLKSNDKEYVGIVINFDDYVASIYDLSMIMGEELRRIFLDLGEVWWWESNRMIPINVFLKHDWSEFKFCVKTMNSKDVDIRLGPHINLKEMAAKRSKRRSITLIRKI